MLVYFNTFLICFLCLCFIWKYISFMEIAYIDILYIIFVYGNWFTSKNHFNIKSFEIIYNTGTSQSVI